MTMTAMTASRFVMMSLFCPIFSMMVKILLEMIGPLKLEGRYLI